MAVQSRLFLTSREADILKTVGFSWLTWDCLRKSKQLRERNKTKRPPFYVIRTLFNNVCALASVLTVLRATWHLMSL